MESVDLTRFYSAGYFLIRAGNPGWEQLKTDLLPPTLLSLARCITPKVELSWGWTTGNKEDALAFGIREAQWDEFVDWCQHNYKADMDMWSMFHSPDAARRFASRFLDHYENLYLIGVGLPHDLEKSNWREPALDDHEIYGINERVEHRLPLDEGGQPVGFEVVSFTYGSFGHSWLCSYLHVDMHELFGIRPGEFGLIQSEAEARQVYDWIAEDDMEGHRAEPEPYDYWLLVSYPLMEHTP